MFTDKAQILHYLNSHALEVNDLAYISKGAMTDKYRFKSRDKWYVVRCYPIERYWLAETEYLYLKLFQEHGIKSPIPILYTNENQALLVYEELPGKVLSEVYDGLSDEEKNALCLEIIENYKKIAAITVTGYGAITGYNKFSHESWQTFLQDNISLAERIFTGKQKNERLMLVPQWRNRAYKIQIDQSHLVWSDFSTDNIIVNDKHLAGFIDLESLMGGDPLLGLGYLIAHEGKSDVVNRLFRYFNITSRKDYRIIEFYAVLRYIRLVPYLDTNLPNGQKRDAIASFLPYSFKRMNVGNFKNWIIYRILTSLKFYILLLTVGLTLYAMYGIPTFYGDVLNRSQINVGFKSAEAITQNDIPIWFQYNDSTISVSRPIGEEERLVLKSLVSDTISAYKDYIKAVNQLAFQSNISHKNFSSLLKLTLCFVLLGCSSRSLYDYIGHECFKDGQDMEKWWPWYLYRIVICVPIASVLIVAARTSLFSNLFTMRDLNTYLVISFLAGFSIIEFLTMLRRVSKTMFDGK